MCESYLRLIVFITLLFRIDDWPSVGPRRILRRQSSQPVSHSRTEPRRLQSEVAQENRKKVAKNSNSKESCYAIKRLSDDLVTSRDVDTFVNGIVDLALEAKWLAAIQHPHIISIKGMAVGEPLQP